MVYISMATPTCSRLLAQLIRQAFCLALARAGSSSAARIAMMAMTTRSSMSVKAGRLRELDTVGGLSTLERSRRRDAEEIRNAPNAKPQVPKKFQAPKFNASFARVGV